MSELCQILYSDEYLSLMKSLNHSLENKVYTEEALQLTEQVLEIIASHYTTWYYRLQIIIALQKDLFEELDWCETIALENEKNYQIWNYRHLIIERILADAELASRFSYKREFPILNVMLEQDPKNHHVWSYRKWFVQRFEAFEDEQELEFVDKLIDLDLRNNSAWTHRFFLKFNGSRSPTKEEISAEIAFAMQKITQCPQNASSWNYLKGIYAKMDYNTAELEGFCAGLADFENNLVLSTYALEMLATIAKSQGNVDRATQIYDILSLTYDPIRVNYWNYLKQRLH